MACILFIGLLSLVPIAILGRAVHDDEERLPWSCLIMDLRTKCRTERSPTVSLTRICRAPNSQPLVTKYTTAFSDRQTRVCHRGPCQKELRMPRALLHPRLGRPRCRGGRAPPSLGTPLQTEGLREGGRVALLSSGRPWGPAWPLTEVCRRSVDLSVNVRPHALHMNGFSPVWIRWWRWSALSCVNCLPHWSQQ